MDIVRLLVSAVVFVMIASLFIRAIPSLVKIVVIFAIIGLLVGLARDLGLLVF